MSKHRWSVTLASAREIIPVGVDRTEIARTYLRAELPTIISSTHPAAPDVINSSVADLDGKQLWRLLEALSFTYRINDVLSWITSTGVDWYETKLPINAIKLGGMAPHINAVTHSPTINRNPRKFAAYLDTYFTAHPHTDPQHLGEFRRTGGPIHHTMLLTCEHKDGITTLDGAHRLTELARAGTKTIRAYSAVRTRKGTHMTGDATFATLASLFEHTGNHHRDKITDVALMLARESTDGPQAVEDYWITHPQSKRLKKAGKKIRRNLR